MELVNTLCKFVPAVFMFRTLPSFPSVVEKAYFSCLRYHLLTMYVSCVRNGEKEKFSEDLKCTIVNFTLERKLLLEIGRRMGKSHSTVQNYISKKLKCRGTTKNKFRSFSYFLDRLPEIH